LHVHEYKCVDPIFFFMVSMSEFSSLENHFASSDSASPSMASLAHSSSSDGGELPLPPAPATVVQTVNISSHVPVVLDLADSNYSQWRTVFGSTLGKLGFTTHVAGSALIPDHDAEWVLLDHTVVNWIYITMSKNVFDIMYQLRASAYSIWSDVEGLFRDNELQRAMLSEAEFRNLQQGDLSMTDYTTKLKKLADNLREVGQPVPESSQVLNMLRGLNPKYRYVKPIIAGRLPPHTFRTARFFLFLEDLNADNDAKMDAGQALLDGHCTGASCGFLAGNDSSSSGASSGNYRSKPRNQNQKRHGKGGGDGNTGGAASSAPRQGNASQSWASGYNPWTSLVQA
jgi:hypothetical protein